jgi:hypothetical protein
MAVTLKIPFLWGVMFSAFVGGYTVESVGGIFGLHIREKIISFDGKAPWYSETKTTSAAELNVATVEMDTKTNGLTLQMILIVICKYLNIYIYIYLNLCPVSSYNRDHIVSIKYFMFC